jgi:6-phosphogluconolactonase (cycloisomerase 2 family)
MANLYMHPIEVMPMTFQYLKLEKMETVLCGKSENGGETTRNFAITKDGEYLLAAHQGSNNITVFERNQKTGKLSKMNIEGSFHNKPVYFFRAELNSKKQENSYLQRL